jgi:hypothetical protein
MTPDTLNAVIYGAAAVLLIAGSYTVAQWLLARIYHDPLEGDGRGR